MKQAWMDRFKSALLLIALTGLVAGLGLSMAGQGALATAAYVVGVVPVLLALLIEIFRSLRLGNVGLDIVAALSMAAALVFGETLAAAVVAVMYSGGTFLESFAEGRARREMHDLLARVPRTATRHRNGGLEEIPLDEIAPGDLLLIRQGDVVPVDGAVASGVAFVDTSALTGESLPVRLSRGAVALVASLSRAAHFGVLIKGAGPLEAMARIRTLILDKTGTLTDGRPRIVSIDSVGEIEEGDILRFAAALDQASKHPVAQAIVAAAKSKCPVLPVPSGVAEIPGEGVIGTVDGRSVAVGGVDFVARHIGAEAAPHPGLAAGSVLVALAVDGRMAGHLVMADPLRQEAGAMLDRLRRGGMTRILLATGDRAAVAEQVTQGLGLDGLRAGLSPDQKVLLVLSERKNGPVMMVGDGVNDAPALAAADVGVAMGARGAAASAEAADVVLLVDRIDRLGQGIEIARQSRRIAVESVVAGIGLSVAGMIAAAFGYLTPVQGALLQEAIDVAVILNALRALRITPTGAPVEPQP